MFQNFFLLLISALMACGTSDRKTRPENATMVTTEKIEKKSIYDFKAKAIDGKEIDFAQFKGKKLLIVNTASACGYTPQYADLQKLHEQMGDKVLILGFPANNFGGQEPDGNAEIAAFCKKNYGVTFQMFEKVDVVGKGQHPLFQWLSDKDQNGWNSETPKWNFSKYLINEKGELIKYFGSKVKPFDAELLEAIKG